MELPDVCITVNERANIFHKEYNIDVKIITAYLTFYTVHTDGPSVVDTDSCPKLDEHTHWLNSPLPTGPETTYNTATK
jgi:hypothetical protein